MSINNINVKNLQQNLESQDNDALLIDVRENEEWHHCRIKQAVHIPLARIEDLIENVAPNLNQPIYLQCRSGGRSMQAALRLQNLGYTKLFNVDGGILAWIQEGFAIEAS